MSNPTFNFHTTAEEVTSYFASRITSRTFLVTGVSPNGLGLATALALAPHSPALLILAARSEASLQAAKAAVLELAPTCPVRTLNLDLSSFATVRKAAAEVNSWDDVKGLDVLINNAGIMATPYAKTEDGVEQQFAVNHLAPWLFTNLLVDKLAAVKGRVVFLSSLGHMYGPVRFEDVNFNVSSLNPPTTKIQNNWSDWESQDGKDYNPDTSYGQSKTANILCAQAFTQKLRPTKSITSFSVHPGAIITNLGRHVPFSAWKEKGILDAEGNLTLPSKTQSQGSATTLVAALDPAIEERSGAYLVDCKVDHEDPWAEYAKGQENAERLWGLSEELVGEKFAY
jgi:NAD(P)-dependent dehydrogenase (short-subunit alcohol dehydrogenase family)